MQTTDQYQYETHTKHVDRIKEKVKEEEREKRIKSLTPGQKRELDRYTSTNQVGVDKDNLQRHEHISYLVFYGLIELSEEVNGVMYYKRTY